MPRVSHSRRQWLQTSASLCGAAATLSCSDMLALVAAEKPTNPYLPANGFGRMVHEYFLDLARAVERERLQQVAKLKTKADAEAYVAEVRRKIELSFGPWPERTPLNPRITGVVERDAYRIEKVIFESRPKFFVTGNLYLPKGVSFPAPAVLGVCGHSDNGKAYPQYQSFSQALARQGYVVLIFDPIGQGERLQLPDEQLRSRLHAGTAEHGMVGNQQFLVGEFFGTWRTWDGIRALDYLLSRPEVDPKHVGVTGSSGGGTETTWLAGADRRFTMAAPNSFVTSFLRNLENELPADTEQFPPRAMALGLEQSDFLAAMAPGHVILLPQELDNFDVRGTILAYERLKRLYTLLGHPENVSLHIGPEGHGYHQPAREAMVACFNRACGKEGPSAEPKLVLEEDQTLWCTNSGQVVELGSRPVPSFTRQAAEDLAVKRGKVSGETLSTAVRETLKLPARDGLPYYRILRPRHGRGYPLPWFSIYAIETEPGIQAIVYRLSAEAHHARPPAQTNRAIVYVAHDSSDAELRDEPLVKELLKAEPTATLYTCDLRGMGESRPNTFGESGATYHFGSDFVYAEHAIMFDRSYIGMRTHDLLTTLDWVRGIGHSDVHLAAKGYGSLPAALAGLLHDGVAQVTLKHPLPSYTELASTEIYKWPLSAMLPGALARFDLPDVYRELAAKQLRMIEPWGAAAARRT
jgi:dienelactone hydrolase